MQLTTHLHGVTEIQIQAGHFTFIYVEEMLNNASPKVKYYRTDISHLYIISHCVHNYRFSVVIGYI